MFPDDSTRIYILKKKFYCLKMLFDILLQNRIIFLRLQCVFYSIYLSLSFFKFLIYFDFDFVHFSKFIVLNSIIIQEKLKCCLQNIMYQSIYLYINLSTYHYLILLALNLFYYSKWNKIAIHFYLKWEIIVLSSEVKCSIMMIRNSNRVMFCSI